MENLNSLQNMVSVIIPTYNRITLLKRTIESLVVQDYPNFEIIVVNDGSCDDTDEYLKKFATIYKIRYFYQDNRGPAAARNIGLRNAIGEYILYTDDDCIVPTNWVSRFVEAFKLTGADIIGGTVKNCVTDKIFSEVSQDISNHWVQFCNRKFNNSSVMTSNNIGYRRTAIEQAGAFDERFRYPGFEERAMNFKIIHNGGKSVFLPDCVIEHYHDLNLKRFIKQQFNYGRGAYLYYNVISKELGNRPKAVPLSAYLTLVSFFLKKNILKGVIKAMIFLSAQLVGIMGFLYQPFSAFKVIQKVKKQ